MRIKIVVLQGVKNDRTFDDLCAQILGFHEFIVIVAVTYISFSQ